MKKKIRDLTLTDMSAMCTSLYCDDCPLNTIICNTDFTIKSRVDNLSSRLDEEVEVPDGK